MKVYPIIAVLALVLAATLPSLANGTDTPQPSQRLHRGSTTRR
ncbi:MAG: hypothetical protein ACYTXI_38345 [Nostoc sp.]